jgi:hypothetical protein
MGIAVRPFRAATHALNCRQIIMILSTRTVLSLHESVTSIDPTSSHGARKSMASRSWFRRDDKKADVELGMPASLCRRAR